MINKLASRLAGCKHAMQSLLYTLHYQRAQTKSTRGIKRVYLFKWHDWPHTW